MTADRAYATVGDMHDSFATKDVIDKKITEALNGLKFNLEDVQIDGIAGLDRNKVYVIKVKGSFQSETRRNIQQNLLAQFAAHNIAVIVMFVGFDGSTVTINEQGQEVEDRDFNYDIESLRYQLDNERTQHHETREVLNQVEEQLSKANGEIIYLRDFVNHIYSELEELKKQNGTNNP